MRMPNPLDWTTNCTRPVSTEGITLESLLATTRGLPKWTGPVGFVVFEDQAAYIREAIPEFQRPPVCGPFNHPLTGLPIYRVITVEEGARLLWHFGLQKRRLMPIGRLADDLGIKD